MQVLRKYLYRWQNIQHIKRVYSAIGQGCWKCSNTEIRNTFFCASCGALRDTSTEEDYFKLFKLTKQFNVDLVNLTQNFRQIQSVVHPDKFSLSSSEEQALALKWSSIINEAYKTLSNSLDRGKYLLESNGVVISDDNSTLDQDFLLRMMEINESVDEANTISELQELLNNTTADVEDLNKQIDHNFATDELEAAKKGIIHLKYVMNVNATIKDKIMQLSLRH